MESLRGYRGVGRWASDRLGPGRKGGLRDPGRRGHVLKNRCVAYGVTAVLVVGLGVAFPIAASGQQGKDPTVDSEPFRGNEKANLGAWFRVGPAVARVDGAGTEALLVGLAIAGRRHQLGLRLVRGNYYPSGGGEVGLLYGLTWGSRTNRWSVSSGPVWVFDAPGAYKKGSLPFILEWMTDGGPFGVGFQAYAHTLEAKGIYGFAVLFHIGGVGEP